jgi:hypothetical protein
MRTGEANDNLTLEVGHNLSALAVEAQKSRSTSEADLFKMPKKVVHIVRASVQRAPYRGAYADHPGGLRTAS